MMIFRTKIGGSCLFLFLIVSTTYGQAKFADAKAEIFPSQIKAGEKGVLKIILKLPEKAHVNAAIVADPNLIPTTFTPDKIVGITWGEVKYPPTVEVTEWYSVDPLKVYSDGSIIEVPFAIEKDVIGLKKIGGTLNAQACDDEKCYPPKKVSVSVDLQIGAENQTAITKVSAEKSEVKTQSSSADTIEFSFTDYEGKARKLSDYRGKVVLLDFWATWCKPCLADFPKLKELYAKYQENGFEIIGLQAETLGDEEADAAAVAEGFERGKAVAKRFSTNWTMVEPKSSLNAATKVLKVEALPTKILIDREGKIIQLIKPNDDLAKILSELFDKD